MKVVSRNNLFARLIRPSFRLNSDLCDSISYLEVVVHRQTTNAYRVQGGSGGKSYTSVMFAGSPTGFLLPTSVIYKAKRMFDEWCIGGPDDTAYSCTERSIFERESREWKMNAILWHSTASRQIRTMSSISMVDRIDHRSSRWPTLSTKMIFFRGWIDQTSFYEWSDKVFLQQTKNLPRPLLLLVNGYGSHVKVETLKLAVQNDVCVIKRLSPACLFVSVVFCELNNIVEFFQNYCMSSTECNAHLAATWFSVL